MKNKYYIKGLWLIAMILVCSPILAPASVTAEEVFLTKDRDQEGMGVVLNKYFNKIKSTHGIIIYSGCNAQFGTEIFIISNGLKKGLLLQFSGRQFENIAFVDLKDNDGIIISEDGMLRGPWLIHQAQNDIDQIVKLPFHIFLGKSPAEIFDMKFSTMCEDYRGK